MKFFYPIFLLVVAFLPTANFAQVNYVNHAATGTNDGTSWANAFKDLQTALDESDPGDALWVAAGTYRSVANNTSFSMVAGVKMYGGFKGNETTFEARNVAANPTILSGDVANDDTPGDFTKNRTDNSLHVLIINGDATKTSIVDGFRVQGGHTATVNTAPDADRRGGGVLSFTPVEVINCTFSDNYGQSGAAVACLDASASNSRVRFCTIEKNESAGPNVLCSGVFFRQMTGGEIFKCTFKNNKGRGSCYPYYSQGIVIDSCQFESNLADAQPGSSLYSFQASFALKNTVFKANKATAGSAMYNDGVEGNNFFVVENCQFESNQSANAAGTATFGGAVYNFSAKGEFKNCSFSDNSATGTSSRGGAIYNLADTADIAAVLFTKCTFKKNSAPTSGGAIFSRCRPQAKNTVAMKHCLFEENSSTFGGATGGYDLNMAMVYDSCIFRKNTASTSGGAITNGFTASATLKNCLLEENMARSGGGMFNQNNNTLLTIEKTVFTLNLAQGTSMNGTGGALSLSSGIVANIKNSTFQGNGADTGGAITMSADTGATAPLPLINMENTVIQENVANVQGAGINLFNGNVVMSNSLIHGNLNLSTSGAGGAISNNGSRKRTSSVKATNCTFTSNDAPIGAGIGQYADSVSFAHLTLQNCILQNANGNYGIEEGAVSVFTNGGNCSSDATLKDFLKGTNDLNDTDPKFEDPGSNNFQLKTGSPCINKGIAAGAPTTDLLGKLRNGEPDMGCYEFNGLSGGSQPFAKTISLQIMPNPTVDFVQTKIESDEAGDAVAQVFSASGQLLKTLAFEKNAGQHLLKFSVEDLPTGAYLLSVRAAKTWFSGAFLKG